MRLSLALLLVGCSAASHIKPFDDAGASQAALQSDDDASVSIAISCAEPDGAPAPCIGDGGAR